MPYASQAMTRSSTRGASVAVNSTPKLSARPFPAPTWCWRSSDPKFEVKKLHEPTSVVAFEWRYAQYHGAAVVPGAD